MWNLGNLLEVFKEELMVRETCFAVSSSGNQDKEEDRFFTSIAFQTNSYRRKGEKIITCAFCSENHSSNKCSNVTDISQRKQLLRKNERCFICLRKNRVAEDCKSNYKCNKCQLRHNIFICTKDTKTLYTKENKNNIMLQSAVVCVSNVEDYEISIFSRVLFDNCSQRTYITTSLKKKSKLRTIPKENILIQRFASDEGHIEELDVVQLCLRGKTKKLNYYVALCAPYICSPLKEHCVTSLVQETQSQFNHLKEL